MHPADYGGHTVGTVAGDMHPVGCMGHGVTSVGGDMHPAGRVGHSVVSEEVMCILCVWDTL